MMFHFCTEFRAIDNASGDMCTYGGPQIIAITWAEAENICEKNYPWLKVIGRVTSIVPSKPDNIYEPDYDKEVNLLPYSDN